MKLHALILLLQLLLVSFALPVSVSSVHDGDEGVQNSDLSAPGTINRRILHQPLFSSSSSPPPDTDSSDSSVSPPPPPPDSSGGYKPDQQFFPEVPNGEGGRNQTPTSPPPPSSTGSEPIPSATQSTKSTKKVAIVVSVGIVTLGMLCALVFYVYRHKLKHPVEEQKLEGGNSNSHGYADESRVPPSSFLYLGTVEHSGQISVPTTEDISTPDGSPYRKFNPVKKSDRYRPSPDLQPLPPLSRSLAAAPVMRTSPSRNSITTTVLSSSEDEGSHDMAFYTPHGSIASFDEGYSTPNSRQSFRSNGSSRNSFRGEIHGCGSMPYSKRTSSRSRLPASSQDVIKHAIIPSIKTAPQPPPPPPPPLPPQEAPFLQPLSLENKIRHMPGTKSSMPRRAKFGAPPPPPNLALRQSISSQPDHTPEVSTTTTVPPPPPPPPPPQPVSTAPKVRSTWTNYLPRTSEPKSESQYPTSPALKANSWKEKAEPAKNLDGEGTSSGRPNGDDMDGTMSKLRPLHWDKVRATSDRATVWDQMRPSSFQLNEDAMESLFGCSSNNSNNTVNKETNRKPVPPIEEYRIMDPKKSQNIAILLKALNVTQDEVSEALLDGNPEALGAELLETLVKMAPTKEEEIKLKEYKGDNSKLGSAEKFLKAILDIPLAFTRVEAMLYQANFDAEVKYLRKSFETLEEASHELRNSKLFLKLLEAVLKTGNRMNVGTNRGGAKSFKLDALLKLVDVKGTDGKTTLLHFVVQEIIRSEGTGSATMTGNLGNQISSKGKEEEFRRQGLQVVSGLSREIGNVKLAAGMDSDVLHNYLSKLETGLRKVRAVLQNESLDMQGRFFESMKTFVSKAEVEICRIQEDERKALTLVREVTQYFHGDATKEEAHPLRIFMVVRDFLSTLDHVCKDVGTMQDRPVMGAARSFRISSNAPLSVLSRYNARQDDTSSEDSSSP